MRRRRPARFASSAMSRAERLTRPPFPPRAPRGRRPRRPRRPPRRVFEQRLPGRESASPRRARPRHSPRPRREARAPARRAAAGASSTSPAERRAAAAISSGSAPRPSRQRGFDRLGRQRREVDRLAARGDRLQQRRRLGGEQDQVDEPGRLLQRLQQRVLALVAHRLGRLDDEDPLAAFEGPVGGGPDHPLAHLLDQVLGAAWSQPDQVGMRRGIEQRPAPRVLGVLSRRWQGSPRQRPAPPPACRPPAGRGRGRRATGPSASAARRAPARARGWCSVRRQRNASSPRHHRPLTASITRSWTSSTVPSASTTTTRSEAIWAISS